MQLSLFTLLLNFSPVTCGLPSKKANNVESVSMSWRTHVIHTIHWCIVEPTTIVLAPIPHYDNWNINKVVMASISVI